MAEGSNETPVNDTAPSAVTPQCDIPEVIDKVQIAVEPEKKGLSQELDVSKLRDLLLVVVTSWRAVAAVIASVATIVGLTFAVVKFVGIDPLDRENTRVRTELDAAQRQSASLQSKIDQIQQTVRQLSAASDVPILTSPSGGASIVSKQLQFAWTYAKHRPGQPYVVEAVNLSKGGVRRLSFQVPSPDREALNIRELDDLVGQNFWRVRTGDISPQEPGDPV